MYIDITLSRFLHVKIFFLKMFSLNNVQMQNQTLMLKFCFG